MSLPSFHLRLRDARRQHGLTQAQLAQQAGCTQSALSMFESGQGSALAIETLQKMAALLGIALDDTPQTPPQTPRKVFCPNFQCPSALPYFVGDELFFRPAPSALSSSARHCPHCGEILLSACPHCAAPLAEPSGACCTACGKALILATLPPHVSPQVWFQQRRAECVAWHDLCHATKP